MEFGALVLARLLGGAGLGFANKFIVTYIFIAYLKKIANTRHRFTLRTRRLPPPRTAATAVPALGG